MKLYKTDIPALSCIRDGITSINCQYTKFFPEQLVYIRKAPCSGKTVRVTRTCGVVKAPGRRRSCWKKLCAESKLKMLETRRVEYVGLISEGITASLQGFHST
jgi:hypothetical protein